MVLVGKLCAVRGVFFYLCGLKTRTFNDNQYFKQGGDS